MAALFVCGLAASPVAAKDDADVRGAVIDAATGLPLSNVSITALGPEKAHAVSDGRGAFVLRELRPGLYTLEARTSGYVVTTSDPVAVGLADIANVTLALQRVADPNATRVIGRTSTTAARSLQSAGVIYRNVSAESLANGGVYRTVDALRLLPGVNFGGNDVGGGSDTAAFGDDIRLNVRGIGSLETSTLIDGHPIAGGLNKGYNYDLSPVFGLRDVQVIYGSGSQMFYPVNAIGGIIDMRTLEPTPERAFNLSQTYGTFTKLATTLQATGTTPGKLGYAVAVGTQGIDGPIRHTSLYQPATSADPSNPALVPAATYDDDGAFVTRGALAKLRFELAERTHLTTSFLTSYQFDNKTANGDNDFIPYEYAFAEGSALLANKTAKDKCPVGSFTMKGQSISCQTPAQYAGFNTGWAGAGPGFQIYRSNDYHIRLDHAKRVGGDVSVDFFTNRLAHYYDRIYQLPYATVPGDSGYDYTESATATGATFTDEFTTERNTFALGYTWTNSAFVYDKTYPNQTKADLQTNAITHDGAYFLRDAVQLSRVPVTAYGTVWFKHSTVTNTSATDPRISLIYQGRNDVIRIGGGGTMTQPYASNLYTPFSSKLPAKVTSSWSGGNSVNSIGSLSNAALQPERGFDQDFSIGHRWAGDSQTQITLYNANVFNKIYSYTVPLSLFGTSFISPADLQPYIDVASVKSPGANPLDVLGIDSNINLGHLNARGIEISGRQRLNRRFYVDYDYGVQSVSIVKPAASLMKANLALIPGAQIPGVPLHKYDLSLNYSGQNRVTGSITYHAVGENNSKNLGAYDFTDLALGLPAGQGVFTIAVGNAFNQFADYRGLYGYGQPHALNQYASPADYAAYTGAAATERFGIPSRQIDFTYSVHLR